MLFRSFREFFQCDVDIIGSREIGAEVDCISAILEVFQFVGMAGIEVHLNDRRLLSALRDEELSPAQWNEALVILDKLDKISPEGVEKELVQKFGAVPKGLSLLLSSGSSLSGFSSVSPESVESLSQILELLGGSEKTKIVFNPTLVRGQDYYTGTIFEIRHPDLSGSLGGGGRYNRLMEVFGAPETPAFGGSIGFERLCLLLEEQKRLSSDSGSPQVFLPIFGEETRSRLLTIAKELRKAGLRVDVFPDASVKFGKQLSYAEGRRIPFSLILGSEELRGGQVKIKNMSARSEELIPLSNLTQTMVKLCNQNK